VKPIAFLGGSLDDLRGFPADPRREAGYQLDRVQRCLDLDDWRPMPSIGAGARDPSSRTCWCPQGNLCRGLCGCGLRASRLLEEDAPNGKTGCRFGGNADAGTIGEEAVTSEVFASAWDALEDTQAEAENMRLRSSLMIAISEAVAAWHVTQMEAARRLGVTQPRLNDLLRGHVGKFSLDALVAIAARAGLSVHLEITKAA
jgi:predicted XRE-type DNA-binding protein